MRYFFLLVFIFFVPTFAMSASNFDIPEQLPNNRLVNDFAEVFTDEETEFIEHKLTEYRDSTSIPIYLITIGYNIMSGGSAAIVRIRTEWGIRKDSSVIVLINAESIKTSNITILPGHSLDLSLDSKSCNNIINNNKKLLNEEEYYKASTNTINSIFGYLSHKKEAILSKRISRFNEARNTAIASSILFFIVFISYFYQLKRKKMMLKRKLFQKSLISTELIKPPKPKIEVLKITPISENLSFAIELENLSIKIKNPIVQKELNRMIKIVFLINEQSENLGILFNARHRGSIIKLVERYSDVLRFGIVNEEMKNALLQMEKQIKVTREIFEKELEKLLEEGIKNVEIESQAYMQSLKNRDLI